MSLPSVPAAIREPVLDHRAWRLGEHSLIYPAELSPPTASWADPGFPLSRSQGSRLVESDLAEGVQDGRRVGVKWRE